MTMTNKTANRSGHLQNTHRVHQKPNDPLQDVGCHEIHKTAFDAMATCLRMQNLIYMKIKKQQKQQEGATPLPEECLYFN